MANDLMNTVLVIAVVVLVLNVTGLVNFSALAGVADGEPGVTTVKVEADKACGSTTMTVDYEVAHKSGTDVTAQNATVFINGARKGIYSEGGTFTAQGGDKLIVYNALDPAQTTYLASKAEGTIPCTGQTAAFLTSASFMEGSSVVYEANSAASAETMINDDFTSNPGTALSLGLGETKTLAVRLHPVYEEGYGMADGNTIACRMSDSYIEQAKVTIQYDGSLLGAAKYIPSSTNFAVGNTSETIKYWHLPAIDGAVISTAELLIAIKADDNTNPIGSTNFSCSTFGTDYYEADDGSVLIDVEDRDDNSKIGRTSANEFAWYPILS